MCRLRTFLGPHQNSDILPCRTQAREACPRRRSRLRSPRPSRMGPAFRSISGHSARVNDLLRAVIRYRLITLQVMSCLRSAECETWSKRGRPTDVATPGQEGSVWRVEMDPASDHHKDGSCFVPQSGCGHKGHHARHFRKRADLFASDRHRVPQIKWTGGQ